MAVLQDHTQDVKHVAWHSSELLLASASYDDEIRLWTLDDSEWVCIADLKGHESTVWSCDFEPRPPQGEEEELPGARLVSCSDDQTVRVWKRQSRSGGTKPGQLPSVLAWDVLAEEWVQETILPAVHTGPIYAVAWSSHGIASVGSDGRLAVYQEIDGQWNTTKVVENAHGIYEINTVAWVGSQLVTGGDDGTVKLHEGPSVSP